MINGHWVNKIDEIENTIADFNPDLFLISEAYLFNNDPEYMTNINGYSITHCETFLKHKYSRLVLLIKEGMKVKMRPDLMDDQDVASIWLDLTRRGTKKVILGFIYREHKLLL